MALHPELVAVVFTKLTLTYGRRFADTYNGQHVDVIRGHWAWELDGTPEYALHYALENLPADHPPNVLQFKALCRQAREPMRAALPPPRAMRMGPRVRQQLQACLESLRTPSSDPLAGARRLRDKERNGILLTRAQREFWRIALAREMREESEP